MINFANFTPEQIEILASMTAEAIIDAIKTIKAYDNELNAAKAFFSTLHPTSRARYIQKDENKYDVLKTFLNKYKDKKFYVLYTIDTSDSDLSALNYEMQTIEDLNSLYGINDINLLTHLADKPFQSGVKFSINLKGRPYQGAVTDTDYIDLFMDFENLKFVCRGDLFNIRRLQRAGFIATSQ